MHKPPLLQPQKMLFFILGMLLLQTAKAEKIEPHFQYHLSGMPIGYDLGEATEAAPKHRQFLIRDATRGIHIIRIQETEGKANSNTDSAIQNLDAFFRPLSNSPISITLECNDQAYHQAKPNGSQWYLYFMGDGTPTECRMVEMSVRRIKE